MSYKKIEIDKFNGKLKVKEYNIVFVIKYLTNFFRMDNIFLKVKLNVETVAKLLNDFLVLKKLGNLVVFF